MRKTLLVTATAFLIFSGCKKENNLVEPIQAATNTTNHFPPTDPYKENESLADTNSACYIVADVEGLTGVTKLNRNNTESHASIGYGGGYCSTGSCHYSGDFGCSYSNYGFWQFGAVFYGMGETREQLFTQSNTKFITNASHKYGVMLKYSTDTKTHYNSADSDNPSIKTSNISLIEVTPSGTGSFYFVKFHFSCEMRDYATGKIIKFKNGVARLRI